MVEEECFISKKFSTEDSFLLFQNYQYNSLDDFELQTADIDEKSIRKEKPEDLVMALAEAKVYNQFRRNYGLIYI